MSEVLAADIDVIHRAALHKYRSWKRFHFGPRAENLELLQGLSHYSNPVLVAGCQRSGTTMLTRMIASSRGFVRLSLTNDDELDAALALSGKIDLPKENRYCFQTTYLNERYIEYQRIDSTTKLIWVIRDPESVVYSMLYNWKRFALNEVYVGCGLPQTDIPRLKRHWAPWPVGPSRLERACYSYVGKCAQLEEIREWLSHKNLLVVNYDSLVRAPEKWLPAIFQFVHEPFDATYAHGLSQASLIKKALLTPTQIRRVQDIAEPAYLKCMGYVSGLKEQSRVVE